MENDFKEIEDKLNELSIEFATNLSKSYFMSLTQIVSVAEEYKQALIEKYIYGK